MTGTELQDATAHLAQFCGWRVAHFRPAKTDKGWRTACQYDAKGFPDLVMVRDRLVFVEIKRKVESLSTEQKLWRVLLLAICALAPDIVQYFVWRPADWHDGTIERILRARSRVTERGSRR